MKDPKAMRKPRVQRYINGQWRRCGKVRPWRTCLAMIRADERADRQIPARVVDMFNRVWYENIFARNTGNT